MILNSKNNNFVPNFPKNFFYEKIKERYVPIVNRLPLPYDSLTDYLNASIQQFTFPGVTTETVSQTLNDEFVEWKDGFRFGKVLDKSFTVTFKNYEGYINYWMMFDQYEEFLSKYQKDKFLPNISIRLLDHHGFELLSIEYHQILMTGISDLELNFTSNTAEFESFTCDFKYNYYEIKRRTDKRNI